MSLRVTLAVTACKLSRWAIRLLGGGGTDFPGKVAVKLCPDLLGRVSKGVTTVLITGTNGKTTTARMIEQELTDGGKQVFANRSGANLLTGITAEYAIHARLSGKSRYTHAVIEVDEAAFKHVAKYTDPAAVVITNLFRDQLDRYGEVTGTLDNLRLGVQNSPHATLCLNADESMTASLALDVPNPVIYYGVDGPIYAETTAEVSDAPYCIRCKQPYEYDYVTYGHLGAYRCPGCGWKRPTPQVSVTQVLALEADASRIRLQVEGEAFETAVNAPGGFNLYNACACVALGLALGIDHKTAVGALSTFAVGFGRMEQFTIQNHTMRMILVKNPAGVNQTINYLQTIQEPAFFVFCLTDRVSDGTDISWIWDVDFEKVAAMGDRVTGIVFSGNRAEEMALRAKYAGVDLGKTQICKDYGEMLNLCLAQDRPVYMMPTYTAMLQLREKLSKTYGLKNYWA